MTAVLGSLTSRQLRRLGPHLVDCREHFGEWPINLEELQRLSRPVVAHGRGPGSLETDETAGLDYRVIDADGVREHLPELHLAYQSFASKASDILGLEVVPSQDRGAVAVNIVPTGGRYELHVDSQPWVLILFITEHWRDVNSGGALVVHHPICGRLRVPPVFGQGVLLDGSRLPHEVEPTHGVRVTVPMVYVDPAVGDVRPQGTDEHIYGSAT